MKWGRGGGHRERVKEEKRDRGDEMGKGRREQGKKGERGRA